MPAEGTQRVGSRCVRTALTALGVSVLVACTLEPRYRAPPLPVAAQWPIPPVTVPDAAAGSAGEPAASMASPATAASPAGPAARDVGWRDFFADPHLQALIAQALANNRDLRVAVLNVESARAQYRIQRAAQLPSVEGSGTFTRQKIPPALEYGFPVSINQYYDVSAGVSSFEVDLWGRVRSLSHAALETYLSQQESRRAAQLSLIAEIAEAYLTLAADRDLQGLAANTLKSQQDSYALTQKSYEAGGVSGLDLAEARTTVESARADAARYDGNVAQDIDALTLLVGATVDPALLPQGLASGVTELHAVPAQMPSSVLLRRPDVLAAEHALRSANANIGAARAAFFPTIDLTANIGSASGALSGLFKAGTEAWTFAPQVTVPIFEGGRLLGNLSAARAAQGIAVAQYEKSIQSGFREVADALALSASLVRQREAEQALADATARAFELSMQRYHAGRDSYLNVLDAQRSNYAAQQGLISVRMAEQQNLVTLYRALGGGWLEHSR
jgi:multidrug efflux system outer membrane protein